MTWRGPRTPSNPLYSSRGWAKVKNHWITLRHPICQAPRCLYPGIPISYEKPLTRRLSFNCGHIVSVRNGLLRGWTQEQIWSLANSRPEHRACNIADGARQGQKAQAAKMAARVNLQTSRRW
jgi:hypothetical protein